MTDAFSNPSSFAGFFSDRVSVSGSRANGVSVRGTFAACVMPAERLDPFAEDAAQSKIYKRTVLVPKVGDGAWNLKDPPQIGDTVTIGITAWKVFSVNPFVDEHFDLEVRSC